MVCRRVGSAVERGIERKAEEGRTVLDLTGELRDVCVRDGIEALVGVDGEEDGGIGLGEFDELAERRREVSSGSNEAVSRNSRRTFSGAAPPAPVV